MSSDPLDIIAESYRLTAETQRTLAQTQRLGLRLQGFALFLVGTTLLFTGYVVWQHVMMRQESAALNQAVLHNTQSIAAQTQAILERMRHP